MLFEKNTAYLIDTENVGSTWTNLLKENSKKMDLYVFVTENAKNLNFKLLHELTNTKVNLKIIDCEIGKNSLDFYLASYLGYLIGKNASSSYVVVSQDNGFDHVIEYWNLQGIKVERIDTKPVVLKKPKVVRKKKERPITTLVSSETRFIPAREALKKEDKKSEKPKTKKPVKKESKKEEKKEIVKVNPQVELLQNLLIDYDQEKIKTVKKVLDSTPSKQSQDVYVHLVKKLKQEEGLKTYNLLKKSLRKYYSLSESKESN